MPITSEAKRLLAETIRGTAQSPEKGLRARLLRALHDEADRRYRLSVPIAKAELDEAHRRRRERLEAWIEEQVRAAPPPRNDAELKARFRAQAEKEAATTLLNRLVLLRQLEAVGLSKPAVLTGGWNSKGYREFRQFAPALCANDSSDGTEGYATLLQLVFDELAIDLPGLFGDVGLTRLFAIPAAALREVVERLDDRGLESAWKDDTTLGWVFQYLNDPEREALDAKVGDGGKIEPHEIASKTQMFTERYMVEWLLQNSLGLTWLYMCQKKGWTADAEKVLPALEARRTDWRARRDAGEVALDALMPIEGELEEHWKYFVPQPIPEDAVKKAPEELRSLKILDPACGSGHFLVIAFGMLVALYREEARNRGEERTDREIGESILENNLFGIDIDPRAIQIAAAALYLRARSLAKEARPKRLNLVATALQLDKLPEDDPAVVQLRVDLEREVGIPEELTDRLLAALYGVDHLGALLKVDTDVTTALRNVERQLEQAQGQGDLFRGFPVETVRLSMGDARETVLDRLKAFLARHTKSADLGLRLDGEQLAAGVRFLGIATEGAYDVVVGNPPYMGVGKLGDASYYLTHYPDGRADLFAGFYMRGLEFVRVRGICAFITLSNWMFLETYRGLRRVLLGNTTLTLADLGKAAFSTGGTLISTACAVFARGSQQQAAIALRPHAPEEVVRDEGQPERTRAALLLHRGRYEFDPGGFKVIKGEPIVYWWSKKFLERYSETPKLETLSPARNGMSTQDNTRFLRRPWEVLPAGFLVTGIGSRPGFGLGKWAPYIKGAAGQQWFEGIDDIVRWDHFGLEAKVFCAYLYGSHSRTIKNEVLYFQHGVAFTAIGASFSARAHRTASVFGHMGTSVFPSNIPETLCLLNSTLSRIILASLNPGLHFLTSDVNRLPVVPIEGADQIYSTIEDGFAAHEAGREPSVEYRRPGASPWRYAQSWAQTAVDREQSAPLPQYQPEYDPPEPQAFVSFAVGIALGRFGANGEGILDTAPATALPTGIFFLSVESGDSLDLPACAPLTSAWEEYGAAVGGGDDLRTYLRKSFFAYHKKLYENRPIYFPLSSAGKSFVAWISIHRWQDDTLNVLLADHLVPTRRRFEGELQDLRAARSAGPTKARAERRYSDLQKLLEELTDFIAKVTEIAENGPPPPDDKTPKREVDARFTMDLDDGVLVNSAALWPLLEPQWKDPKKWWKELATAQGKKDYDWAHLAARYFPTRARQKCHDDPSLAVAHHCFWELHPAKAYAWELRLQDEIRPDFTIDEPGSDAARAKFLTDHTPEAAAILANEEKRRDRKAAKADDDGGAGTLFVDQLEEPAEE